MNRTQSRGVVAALLLLATAVPGALLAGAADERSARRTGWADLSAVAPSTAVVVVLTDGRRLERRVVGTTAEALITVDLSAIASRDLRERVLALMRDSPQQYSGAVFVEDDGKRIPIVQRFDRASIVVVARPKPLVFRPSAPLSWLLSYSAPCPNCDAVQTAFGATPLPSPLARQASLAPLIGEVLYAAPSVAALDMLGPMTWRQMKDMLPTSLRGK